MTALSPGGIHYDHCAARTVIVDDAGRFAILAVNGGSYFKIPGGGIEDGESVEAAARREAREEAGCRVELIRRIGKHSSSCIHPVRGPTSHWSVCFLARRIGAQQTPIFTAEERQLKMTLHWWGYARALRSFQNARPMTEVERAINARDMGFLIAAREYLTGTDPVRKTSQGYVAS